MLDGEVFGDGSPARLGEKSDRRLARSQRIGEVAISDSHSTNVAGLGKLGHQLPAGVRLVLVPARMKSEGNDLQQHVLGRSRPGDLRFQLRIEEVLNALDLDRRLILAVPEIDAANRAGDRLPVSLLVLDNDLLGDVGKVGYQIFTDRF